MALRVLKFGGTSVGSAESIAATCEIVSAAVAEPAARAFVVVSALAGVTNQLVHLTELSRRMRTRRVEALLADLEQRHRATADAVAPDADADGRWAREFAPLVRRLRLVLVSTSLIGDMTERTYAAVLAYGEQLSSRILTRALRARGVAAEHVDATRLVRTHGSYLDADVNWPRTRVGFRRRAAPLVAAGRVPVMAGFVGRDASGHVTLLGRGGSDYSASIAGMCLGADAVEIWTDVDGVMSADPRVVRRGVRTWRAIELAVVSEMAHGGAKVLHPKTISAAVEQDIPVVVKNTFRRAAPGTTIVRDGSRPALRGVVAQGGQTLLHFREPGMLSRPGFIHRCSEVFTRRGVPIDVCATSEITFSCTIAASQYTEALRAELASVAEVTVYPGVAKVCVIGNRVTGDPRLLERVMRVLRGRRLYAVSVGASFTNVTLLVDEAESSAILRSLHRALFRP